MPAQKETLIRLQDLDFIAAELNNGGRALTDSERREVEQDFLRMQTEVNAFFVKVVPQAIDAVCLINDMITVRNNTLCFKNAVVPSSALDGGNCFDVCRAAITAFPVTLKAMVTTLKSGASAGYIEEASQKLCREFNTVRAYREGAARLQSERIAWLCAAKPNENAADSTADFSKVISIPLGKDGEKEISINFHSKRPDAHAVILGTTGTGKSSLLQSIILGGAFKYSPEQLQFWILDFKDGTGFVQLQGLKHVRMMCLKNRAVDANEVMEFIKKEYVSRTDKIRTSGGGDICTYNERAKAKGVPLMPRLVIIIDEFVIMHRTCFSALNYLAKVGRSVGMSFVLSSQVMEMGAAYSDAVQQAAHLFEFKNSDSVFGRLVKNVTDEERRFVSSEIPGNCIYRYGSGRNAFRAAYAGNVNEQIDFVQTINERWKDVPTAETIIAGQPERILSAPSELKCDAAAVRDTYKSSKKVFVPIGKSRMGKPYMYKIDRDNPLLVMFGDEARVASVEFSVIEHFKNLAGEENAVCYIDLSRNSDREENAVTAKYRTPQSGVDYAETDSDASIAIDRVYKILNARKKLSQADKSKDIGNPIELIIHNAERVTELQTEKRAPRISAVTRSAVPPPAVGDMDLSAFIASAAKPTKPERSAAEDDIGTLQKLKEIIESGKDNRIFVMLYFEERGKFQSLVGKLFAYGDFKDVLVAPKIPDLYEELSYSEVADSLAVCRLSNQASDFTSEILEQSDFICAVLIDDKVPHKIIPFEWTAR